MYLDPNKGQPLNWVNIFVKVRICFYCVGKSHISQLFDGSGGAKACMWGEAGDCVNEKALQNFFNGDFFEFLLDLFES